MRVIRNRLSAKIFFRSDATLILTCFQKKKKTQSKSEKPFVNVYMSRKDVSAYDLIVCLYASRI